MIYPPGSVASLLVDNAKDHLDCHVDVTKEEVNDGVRQLQSSSLSAHSIPQFYFGPAKVEKGSVAWHMRRVVQRKQAGERMAELTILQTAMQEYSAEHDGADRIPYSEFNKILHHHGLVNSPFNFPHLFLKQHEVNNCVCIRTLCEELEPRLWRITMSLMLIEYDDDADGYLTLHEVQRWLSDFADEHHWPIPSSLRSKWLVIAPRKIFFLLGHNNLVSIEKLVQHGDMLQLLEHPVFSDHGDNLDWFGPQKVEQVWQKFSDLDRDGDGLLNMQEVGSVRPNSAGHSTMAPYFLQRVWEVHVTAVSPVDKMPAMSLEEFVDFLLAWQNRGQAASCRYFFKAFDIEHRGKLTGTVISKWCHLVFEHSQWLGMADEDQDPENLRNEIFDFVKPSSKAHVTLDDLCKSEPTGDHPSILDVCGVLCDAQCMISQCGQ